MPLCTSVRRILSCLVVPSLVILATIGILAGCDSDGDCLECPADGTRGITGRITGGGGAPLSGTVSAKDTAGDFLEQGPTGPSGEFNLRLPEGRYVLRFSVRDTVNSGGASGYFRGGSIVREHPETLLVASFGWTRADVVLGSVEVELRPDAGWPRTPVVAMLRMDPDQSVYANADGLFMSHGLAVFHFPVVVPGRYRLEVHGDQSLVYASPESLTVRPGEETFFEGTVPVPAVLEGSVTGAWQEMGLRPPCVRMFDADSNWVGSSCLESDGTFQLLTRGQRVRLLVQFEGSRRWYGGKTFEEATFFEPRPGSTESVLIRDSGIAGRINRAEEPNGYGYGSLVEVFGAEGDLAAETSIQNGLFFVPNLVPGSYFVHFPGQSGWIEQWHDHAASLSEATPIVLTDEGNVERVDFDLDEGGRLSGRIAGPEGRPILSAYFRLTRSTSAETLRGGFHASVDGTFRIAGLEDGAYKLGIETPRGQTTWYPGTADWDSAGVLTIVDHGLIEDLVITVLR